MVDPLIATAISIGMALLFLSAAWHKLNALQQFMASLRDYQLLPDWLVAPAARLLPIVEVALGIAWFVSWSLQYIAIASAALLTLYTVAIGINVARGRVHIGCGCSAPGSNGGDQPISIGLVIRNCVLIGVSLLSGMPVADRDLGAADYLVLLVTLAAALLLYATVNQLLTNDGVIRTWRSSRG